MNYNNSNSQYMSGFQGGSGQIQSFLSNIGNNQNNPSFFSQNQTPQHQQNFWSNNTPANPKPQTYNAGNYGQTSAPEILNMSMASMNPSQSNLGISSSQQNLQTMNQYARNQENINRERTNSAISDHRPTRESFQINQQYIRDEEQARTPIREEEESAHSQGI